MGYKIIKDNIHEGSHEEYSLVGKEYSSYQGGKHRYRLIDDDGNVYFYLVSDTHADEGDADELFAPLDRFMYSYGCTEIQYKDSDGEYKTL